MGAATWHLESGNKRAGSDVTLAGLACIGGLAQKPSAAALAWWVRWRHSLGASTDGRRPRLRRRARIAMPSCSIAGKQRHASRSRGILFAHRNADPAAQLSCEQWDDRDD